MAIELFDMVDMDYLFTVVTADRAVDYIGKEVYVADSITDLEIQIRQGITHILDSVRNTSYELRFNTLNNNGSTNAYALCVPADKVKQPPKEKKYRPFKSVDEFELYTGFSIGAVIKHKYVGTALYLPSIATYMYIGSGRDMEDKEYIILGGIKLYIAELIEYEYLWQEDNLEEWRPFGVPEDER